jgi:hypothetical protein
VGSVTAIRLPDPDSGGKGGSGDVGSVTAIRLPDPDSGGNGGNGDVGSVTAIRLPDPDSGGKGGNGDVGSVTATDPVPWWTGTGAERGPANADPAAKKAKLATKTVVRILTKLANIELYLLGIEKKLSW